MQPFSIVEPLQQLFQEHHISYVIEDDWLIPYADFARFPAIRTLWFPYEVNGCLQVEVFHHNQTLIIECFAGIGYGNDAIHDAMQNFCLNSFHVFGVAFWDLQHDNQVQIDQWKIAENNYTVYIGQMGTRLIDLPELPVLPDGWFEILKNEILKQINFENMAWFRVFIGNNQERLTIEILKNNEVWEEAQDMMKDLAWVQCKGYYSIRCFILLNVESKSTLMV